MNLDDRNQYISSMDSNMFDGFGINYLSHLRSFVDISFCNFNHIVSSEGIALQEAFNRISKFAGALFFWLSANSNPIRGLKISRIISQRLKTRNCHVSPKIKHCTYMNKIKRFHLFFGSDLQSAIPLFFAKFTNSIAKKLWNDVGQWQGFPMLSLAATLMPPFEEMPVKLLFKSIMVGIVDNQISEHVVAQNKDENHRICDMCVVPSRTLIKDAVEPKTGIKFPNFLDKHLSGEVTSNFTPEVLVGIGFRSMTVIKFKSLKIYAFGLYVHYDSICKKLGHKYASIPATELKDCSAFYEDLLREDVGLTVRLVVNYNGLKINAVRDDLALLYIAAPLRSPCAIGCLR